MESLQLQLLTYKKNIRWIQILSRLEHSNHISTTELTQLFEMSTRTINSDIKEIKHYFNQTITVTSSNKGYSFKINDKVDYMERKKELLESEPILTILLGIFNGEKLSTLEWSEQLFFSERALKTHLKKLDPLLSHYQLKLSYPILNIIGKEIDIRNFFLAVFYEEDTLPHYVFPPAIITDIINDMYYTKFEHFHVNVPLFRFSYLLFIAYQRVITGNRLTLNKEIVQLFKNSHLNNTMNQLNNSFRKYTAFSLGSSDLVHLFLMILDSNSYDEELKMASISHDPLNSFFIPIIQDFCTELDIHPDNQTISLIQAFFQINYWKYSASVSCLFLPPSLIHYYKTNYKKEIKQINVFLKKYPHAFWINRSAQFEYTLLIFAMRLMYKLNQKSYNIAFLFEGPIESTIFLEDLARTYTPSNHKTYFFHSHSHTLLPETLNKLSIDLVVTNFSEYIFKIPTEIEVLLFNYIATAEDWNNFISFIDPRLNKKYKIIFDSENKN